jgi:serine/threonine protein kinase
LLARKSMELDEEADIRPLARVGTMVDGAWRIEDLLGIGGAASVYSALHANGRRAALKIMHHRLRDDRDLRARFLQEAELATAIDHPARVVVHGVGATDDGTPLLMMELLEGCTLETVLARVEQLGAAAALMIAEQVLSFLSACHERAVVHRDVKPSNVFLTLDGRIKALDLGVALVSRKRQTGRRLAIGTPTYMAPEQARGAREISARADVFAVGALLFHMLSGIQPRTARTQREVLCMAAVERLRPIQLVAPHVSEHVAALVDNATAFDPADRWKDAAAMRAAVAACLSRERWSPLTLVDLARATLDGADTAPERLTRPEGLSGVLRARPALRGTRTTLPVQIIRLP